MDAKSIINRLKSSSSPAITKLTIIRELRQKSFSEQQEIIGKLRIEKVRSDNSDQQDLIDDIIQQLDPKK